MTVTITEEIKIIIKIITKIIIIIIIVLQIKQTNLTIKGNNDDLRDRALD